LYNPPRVKRAPRVIKPSKQKNSMGRITSLGNDITLQEFKELQGFKYPLFYLI